MTRRWSWRRRQSGGVGLGPAKRGPVRAAPPRPTQEAVAEVDAVTEHDVIACPNTPGGQHHAGEVRRVRALLDDLPDLLEHGAGAQLTEATDLLVAEARGWSPAREHAWLIGGTLEGGATQGIPRRA